MGYFCKTLLAATAVYLPLQTASASDVRFSGFASATGGQTLESGEEYDGYGHRTTFKPNTKLGFRANFSMDDGLSATMQLIGQGENLYDTELDWAYISKEVGDNWRLHFGRQRVPFYMYSSYIDVGIAYHWITPPPGVYSLPFTSFDGVGAQYKTSLGEWDSTLKLIYGEHQSELSTSTLDGDFPAQLVDLTGIRWAGEYNWLTLELGYFQTDVSIDIPDIAALSAGLISAGTALGDAAMINAGARILYESRRASYTSAGAKINFDNYMLVAEYSDLQIEDGFSADQESLYISAGVTVGDIFLHATYTQDEDEPNESIIANLPLTHPDPTTAGLAATATGLILSGAAESTSYILGANYKFHPSAVAKFEYTQFKDELNSGASSRDADSIAFSVDAVF